MTTNPIEPDAVAESEQRSAVEANAAETETGLEENVAGALTYLFGVITGLIFYFVEPDNDFIRFHAAQSMVLFGLVFGVSVALSMLGAVASTILFTGSTGGFVVGSLVSLVLFVAWLVVLLGTFGIWIYMMVRAYQGKTPRVPVAAMLADKLV